MIVICCVCVFAGICIMICQILYFFFFFQAEDGIRDLVRSRGLGDVYKRQNQELVDLDNVVEYIKGV